MTDDEVKQVVHYMNHVYVRTLVKMGMPMGEVQLVYERVGQEMVDDLFQHTIVQRYDDDEALPQ